MYVFASSLLICALLIGCRAIDDFDETKNGYEFIYHDTQNVMITIHNNACYFSAVPDNRLEWGLSDTDLPFIGNMRDRSESYVMKAIADNNHDIVHHTSLEAMREKYQDLLADFHCLDKHIFEMTFPHTSDGFHHGSGH